MARLLVVLALGSTLAACGGTFTKTDELRTLIDEYNNGVRWGRLDQSAVLLPPEDRERFLARHTGLEEKLEILDLDITGMDIAHSKESAEVTIDLSWVLRDRGVVEKTVVVESWRRRGSQWQMVKEVRLRGAPLTLYDDPPKAKE